MVYKGNIQFSSPQFAKKFKQVLMGPKIDKKDSYDVFDVLKKFGNKLDNKYHIKRGKHKFKKGDFVEVMRKYRTNVDEEYKNKYYINEYDVDPDIKEESNTIKGKHFVSAIPYKIVKAGTPLMSMPSVAMPIYSDKGNLRLKKLGKRDIKNDKRAQNLLTKIKEKEEKGKRLKKKKSVKKAKSYKHSSKGKKIRDAGVTHMGDMASANLTLRAMENLAKMNGGKKSKYNVKMARKFRRTRRKRGTGTTGSKKAPKRGSATDGKCDVQNDCAVGYDCVEVTHMDRENTMECRPEKKEGGRRRRKSRRKRRRGTKKRKSGRRKKRTRRRRRKKR